MAINNRSENRAETKAFNTSDFIDDFLFDDSEEKIIGIRNKYYSYGIKQFLEDMNFIFVESELDEPMVQVSLINGSFKFINHMQDKVELEVPYDWDEFEQLIRDYVTENPITRDETDFNTETWTDENEENAFNVISDHVKELREKFGISLEEAKALLNKNRAKLDHTKHSTVFGATGYPEIQLKSGVYNHLVDLIIQNDLDDHFEKIIGSSVRVHINRNSDREDVERKALIDIGFNHIIDNITVNENEYWNNRVIEVKYENQEEREDIDMTDMEDFDKQLKEAEDVTKLRDLKESDGETLVIIGNYIDGRSQDIGLDNQITSCDIFIKESHRDIFDMTLQSDGFMNILTLDEFVTSYVGDKEKMEFFKTQNFLILPSFKGNVRLGVKNMDTDELIEDYNIKDYIYQQNDKYQPFVQVNYLDRTASINGYRLVNLENMLENIDFTADQGNKLNG